MKARTALAAVLLGVASPALAGPPYDTDDPQPTELGHWEIYQFAEASRLDRAVDGSAGVDLNYGAVRDVQLTATLPLGFGREPGQRWRAGRGDLELGVKYRFLSDERAGLAVAVFPRAILPTGSHGFGGDRVRLLLPLWGEKDSGPWSLFGGGGYELNPGPGQRNFWVAGAAITREVRKGLTIGAEISHQGPDTIDAMPETRLGLGGTLALGGAFSLLASAGPTVRGATTGAHGYVALGLQF